MSHQTDIFNYFNLSAPPKQTRQGRPDLKQAAIETKEILPIILPEIPQVNTGRSHFYDTKNLAPLDAKYCPGFKLPDIDPDFGEKGTRIRVFDQDTFDTALQLQPGTTVDAVFPKANHAGMSPRPVKPVAVLNLASERSPGGGWRNGSLAQEEALCYRSSLYLSLHRSYYPLPSLSALYSPHTILIRSSLSEGHSLLYPKNPAVSLPVTAVITLAALRRPKIGSNGEFERSEDRETTKEKIRIVLRVAAHRGHRKLVLGALGCGAFGNPPEQVARCFHEVFEENEFRGGWWEDIAFAVLDNAKGPWGGKDGTGNFGIFYRALDGKIV